MATAFQEDQFCRFAGEAFDVVEAYYNARLWLLATGNWLLSALARGQQPLASASNTTPHWHSRGASITAPARLASWR